MSLRPREAHSRGLREDRVSDPPGLRRLRGIGDELQSHVDRVRILRELQVLPVRGLLVEPEMEDAVLVQARLHIARDGRGDSCRGPAFPDRTNAGAFLDPAGEPDQRIPEVAFEFLARRLAFWNGEEESGRHSFLHFRCMTVGAGLDAADRKSTRLNSSHMSISYAVFCLKKKKKTNKTNLFNQNITNIIKSKL